jgi:hypothetical protein
MSGVSSAQTPCQVYYHVFLYKSLYGKMVDALNQARRHRSESKFFCLHFRNPSTGAVTQLTGKRIIQIYEHFNSIVWCSEEERIAGMVLIYATFFRNVLGSYYQAEQHRNNLSLYCKTVEVPLALFPNLPEDYQKFTIRGNQILALMNASLGNSGVPAIVSAGGPPLQIAQQEAN